MKLRIVETGAREAFELLTGIADRARDASPAYEQAADSIFAFEKRWWQLTYGGQTDKDQRPGRDPAYMEETGGLRASATKRGANRQVVDVGSTYVFVGVTHGLAAIHEKRGRDVMGDPKPADVDNWLEQVGSYIFTGRL